MNRKLLTVGIVSFYLIVALAIMGIINGFDGAKWFDGGFDLIYGVLLIYLSVLLFYSYKKSNDKNIFYIVVGFGAVVLDRVLQIFLQEIHLRANYELAILPWSWAVSDLFMIVGFLFVVWGLRGVVND